MRAGSEAAQQFLEKGIDGIDVIMAAKDNTAKGVIQELMRNGIRVPHQMAVTGFDDLDSGEALFPLLSTVRQPVSEQGSTSAGLLIDMLDHKKVPSKVYAPTRMVIRASCRCPFITPLSREFAVNALSVSPPVLGKNEYTLPSFRKILFALLAFRTDLDHEAIAGKTDQAWKTIASGDDPAALVAAFR